MGERIYPNTVIFKGTDGEEVKYINERVIRKIKAELEDEYNTATGWDGDNDKYAVAMRKALEIIDKHMP